MKHIKLFEEFLNEENENKPTLELGILYWIGRPEVSPSGRFGRRVTTFQTARLNDNGDVIYGQQSYITSGKISKPNDVIHLTKPEFQKLLKNYVK